MTNPIDIDALRQLMEKALDKTKSCLENSRRVVELMQPEMEKFEARTGHNIYATRMCVDHMSAIRTDEKEEAMLSQALDALTELEALRASRGRMAELAKAIDLARNTDARSDWIQVTRLTDAALQPAKDCGEVTHG